MISLVAVALSAVALAVAGYALLTARRAYRASLWAVRATQPARSRPARHSAVDEPAPAAPEPPAAPERAGATREYRAVPPPGGWSRQ